MPNQTKRKRKPAPQHTKAASKKKAVPPKPAPEEKEQIPKQSFLKRLIFGEEKPDLSELEAGSTTILDILSPTAVDTKSRDYIVVDGVFHAYLYIAGYGYATTVGSCWLAPLVEAGEGVSIAYTIRRQSKDKILSKIAQTTMLNRSRMRDVGDTRQDYEELDSAIASGLYLKDAINRQGEDFYYMYTLIEAVADDPDTLEQRITAIEKLCVAVDMIARSCDYKQEQAFLSALPLLNLDPDVERKARRNALTSGVAAAFPFASYELSDRNGIFLGLNMYNRSPVFLDFYDDYKYTNGNCWIGGSSGAGKTFTLNCLGGRLRQQGKRVIYIIPKKGHEFRPQCEQLSGLYLRLSPSSKDCPNIMAIRRKSLNAYSELKHLAARDDSVLAEKISRLVIWYSLQKRDLSDEDKNYLDGSLVECYRRYGITVDNATITDENGNFREMPIRTGTRCFRRRRKQSTSPWCWRGTSPAAPPQWANATTSTSTTSTSCWTFPGCPTTSNSPAFSGRRMWRTTSSWTPPRSCPRSLPTSFGASSVPTQILWRRASCRRWSKRSAASAVSP